MNSFRNIIMLLLGLTLSLGATAQTIVTGSNYYYPPFDGRSMFIKVKSKKP